MFSKIHGSFKFGLGPGSAEGIAEVQRQEALLKTGALQNAILNSANFSSIATDANGVIQIFNVGAERMLGYAAADVLNKITPGRHLRSAGSNRACQNAEHRTWHANYAGL